MLLEDTPSQNEGLTTIHFPDIHINYFRLLLDFLYSGQTYVPVYELEQLQDLLELLQIKPNKWRSGDSRKDIVNGKLIDINKQTKFLITYSIFFMSRFPKIR